MIAAGVGLDLVAGCLGGTNVDWWRWWGLWIGEGGDEDAVLCGGVGDGGRISGLWK